MLSKRIMMFSITVFIIAMMTVSCVQVIYEDPNEVDFSPDETAPVATQDAVMVDEDFRQLQFVQQGDVRIFYDASVAAYLDDAGTFVPPSSGEEAYTDPHPGYADFNFSPMQAHIYVADAAAYQAAADFAPGVIADLQRVIEGMSVADPCVPELPLGTFFHECFHQQFVSNFKQVSFGNGSGVRYVTVYAIQDYAPVGNDSLVYVFQGFSDDGKYYVKMIVEMMHAQLDGVGEIPMEIYAANDAAIINAFFREYAVMFEASENEFTPDLAWIDSVLESLYIQ